MDNEIVNTLNKYFKNDEDNRVLVFWYDEEREFLEDIDDLVLENAEVFKLNKDTPIHDKYVLEMEKPKTNFLLYAPFKQEKDNVNYFADMVHYGELFSENKSEMLCRELNIPLNLSDVVSKYLKVLRVKSYREKLLKLNLDLSIEKNIILGILLVLTDNTSKKSFDDVLRRVLYENLNDENKYIMEFENRGVLDDFWSFVEKLYKYEYKRDVDYLLTSLFLTHASSQLKGNIPASWRKFIIYSNKEKEYINKDIFIFVDSFMKNTDFNNEFDELSDNIEKLMCLKEDIEKIPVESMFKCDTFKVFDEIIIDKSIDFLYNNRVKLPFMDNLKERQTSHFYSDFENVYLMLYWADKIIGESHYLQDLVRPETCDDVIVEYVTHWSLFDKYYRKFIYNYDIISSKTSSMNDLMVLVDNIYTNSFLEKVNPWWTSSLNDLSDLGDVGINKQYNFYKNYIRKNAEKHKIAVIISDAMRYNIGKELKEKLDTNPRRKTEIEPMLGVLPSYTKLGMASLLPHKTLEYNDKLDVIIDGINTSSTKNRQKILNNYHEDAIALTYNDLTGIKKEDIKEKLKDKKLVYIYHDKIDAIGDNKSTENDVFDAAEKTINDIAGLIKDLTNYANFSKFFITADHGFIYKRSKQDESDKIDLIDTNVEYLNRRFLLSKNPIKLDSTYTFKLNYLDNDDYYVTTPVGVDIFKTKGGGVNFFHGGASLQELIIPVVSVKSQKGAKNQEKVDLELIISNNQITNHNFILNFVQKENITNKILPLEVRTYFIDSEGNRISNENIINADVNSDNPQDREFRKKFTLLSTFNYSRKEDYYLIIEDVENSRELHNYKFTIDLAFNDGFEF